MDERDGQKKEEEKKFYKVEKEFQKCNVNCADVLPDGLSAACYSIS